jgi:hypothetical protein
VKGERIRGRGEIMVRVKGENRDGEKETFREKAREQRK